MRVDIIGCKASERVDCTDDGNTFATHGDLFSIDCPSECDKAEFKIVAFLSKISIFVEKYDFWRKLRFLSKITIFDPHFDV